MRHNIIHIYFYINIISIFYFYFLVNYAEYNAEYKLFEYIDGYKVRLEPGDVLWNPPFYWHAVKNATDSIGVGYRWFAPGYSFKISPFYMFLDFFARNPPIWKTFKVFKNDVNQLHLAEHKKLKEANQKLEELKAKKTKTSV